VRKYAGDYDLFRQVVIRAVNLCVVLDDRLCGNNPRTEEVLNRSVQVWFCQFQHHNFQEQWTISRTSYKEGEWKPNINCNGLN